MVSRGDSLHCWLHSHDAVWVTIHASLEATSSTTEKTLSSVLEYEYIGLTRAQTVTAPSVFLLFHAWIQCDSTLSG